MLIRCFAREKESEPKCRRIKDCHPGILAHPRLALRRQARRSSGNPTDLKLWLRVERTRFSSGRYQPIKWLSTRATTSTKPNSNCN
jgi:hypothetical protein